MAAALSEDVLDQNGQNDHFGQNDLVPNWILTFDGPKLGERQITHLICARLKYDLYDFFRGCFWGLLYKKKKGSRPKTPPKKVIQIIF